MSLTDYNRYAIFKNDLVFCSQMQLTVTFQYHRTLARVNTQAMRCSDSTGCKLKPPLVMSPSCGFK